MGAKIVTEKSIDSQFSRKKTLQNNMQKLLHDQNFSNSQMFEENNHEKVVEVSIILLSSLQK